VCRLGRFAFGTMRLVNASSFSLPILAESVHWPSRLTARCWSRLVLTRMVCHQWCLSCYECK
jgi:hypothetical protein